MRRHSLLFLLTLAMATLAHPGLAQESSSGGAYKVLKTNKAGAEGGYDYIFADVKGRRLYVPRGGKTGQVMVFSLDTLQSVGAVEGVSSGGATVDAASGHGFSTTKPITMWDARTLKTIKTIDVDGRPDGIL